MKSAYKFKILILILVIACLGYFLLKPKGNQKVINTYIKLPTQERIVHETKYRLTPSFDPKSRQVKLNIVIESFQNPEALAEQPIDILGIEDNLENSYIPIKWNEEEKTPHKIQGSLIFPSISKTAQKMTFKIFSFDVEEFTWPIPSN